MYFLKRNYINVLFLVNFFGEPYKYIYMIKYNQIINIKLVLISDT